MRIHGVEVKEKESEDDVMNTLEKCYSSLNVPFDPNDIDWAHRIRLSYTDNHSGEKVKFIIIKFRPWKVRQLFYKSPPRYYIDSLKKPGFSVSGAVYISWDISPRWDVSSEWGTFHPS